MIHELQLDILNYNYKLQPMNDMNYNYHHKLQPIIIIQDA